MTGEEFISDNEAIRDGERATSHMDHLPSLWSTERVKACWVFIIPGLY